MTALHAPEHLVSRLRFRHLRLLTELERGGSLRAAALALNLTQPALSKALAEIEAAFGFALFARTARGLKPTTQGGVVIRGAALLLKELAHVQSEAQSGDRFAASLRIGAPPFVAQGYLPLALKRLVGHTPPIRVQLLEERVPALMQALVKGEVDALLTTYPAEMPEPGGVSLHYEKLFDVQFLIIAPKNHRLARARSVSWHDLAQEPWVLPAQGAMARRVMEDCFMRAGVLPPTPVIESASPVTNAELVATGIGLGVAPDITLIAHAKHRKRVDQVRVKPEVPPSPVALIYRAGVDNCRVSLFKDALHGCAPALSIDRNGAPRRASAPPMAKPPPWAT
jgi:DNA-binding transcriptional LysR family regulator